MRMFRLVAALALVVSCSHSAPSRVSNPPPAAAASAAAQIAKRTLDDERTADESAYRFLYLPAQKHLAVSHRGGWLAVANGQVVPAQGAELAPAKTMEEADAAARRAAPDARHRFVFQIGEEGDVEWQLGGCELQHVVGNQVMALLEAKGVEMRNIGPGERMRIRIGGVSTELTVQTPDELRMYLRPEIGPPGGPGKAAENFCLSTGFAGFATMAPATAAGLEMWEIPGVAKVRGAVQSADCRRARARLAWPNTPLEFVVPVAVWPK